MTVGELVAILAKSPSDLRVMHEDECAYLDVGSVSMRSDADGPYLLIESEWTSAEREWLERMKSKAAGRR